MESYLGQQQRCHKVCYPRYGGHFQVSAPHTNIGSAQEYSHLLRITQVYHKFQIRSKDAEVQSEDYMIT